LKNREAMAALHREGVLFAVGTDEGIIQDDPSVPPPHVAFLEILAEFTNKLLKQDKRIVYAIHFYSFYIMDFSNLLPICLVLTIWINTLHQQYLQVVVKTGNLG